MQYNYLFFDLDGTLIDSKEGIMNSFRYAFNRLGVSIPNEKELETMIGPPLQEGFKKILNMDNKGAERAVYLFREYYGTKGIYENNPYPGIHQLLEELSLNGKKVFVATSKLEKYAWLVLDHSDLKPYIDDMAGADYGGNLSDKSILIQRLIDRNKLSDKSKMVMIGDTHFDMTGADEVNISKIAIGYGYGKMEELMSYIPNHYAESVNELYEILLG